MSKFLIVDNYGTHKTPAIKTWLAQHPRFELHFTPTGSSWTNQVERWFGCLARQVIRRSAHTTIHALEANICDPGSLWCDSLASFLIRRCESAISSAGRGRSLPI
ncbi:transposase [Streptomyces sp. NPDC001139]